MKVTKEYCDICGKEINIRLPVRFTKYRVLICVEEYDCCEACWSEIYRFAEALKKTRGSKKND